MSNRPIERTAEDLLRMALALTERIDGAVDGLAWCRQNGDRVPDDAYMSAMLDIEGDAAILHDAIKRYFGDD